ncbi:MAG: hypothetical protein KDD58_16070, partial [Bdellovibrionales bacterium]|nr:hypothetical protein [Bdellovibrionales bacterium]
MKLFTIAISILLGHAVLADIDQIAHENKTKFAQIQECINKVNKGSEVWRNSNQMSSDLVYSLNDLIHIDLQVQLRYQHYFTQ